MIKTLQRSAAAISFVGIALTLSVAKAQENIYYPKPKISETQKTIARALPELTEMHRYRLADQINASSAKQLGDPEFAVLAVGPGSKTFLVSATGDGILNTRYRALAAVARMTASIRTAPILVENGLENDFNSFDYLWLLGFNRLVISDGDKFAYEFIISDTEGERR